LLHGDLAHRQKYLYLLAGPRTQRASTDGTSKWIEADLLQLNTVGYVLDQQETLNVLAWAGTERTLADWTEHRVDADLRRHGRRSWRKLGDCSSSESSEDKHEVKQSLPHCVPPSLSSRLNCRVPPNER
jgi:hypothetical protein